MCQSYLLDEPTLQRKDRRQLLQFHRCLQFHRYRRRFHRHRGYHCLEDYTDKVDIKIDEKMSNTENII